MKTSAQVKIVEYHESLAKGVAKMWNESRDDWGGDSTVMSEQDVIEKEANSANLHLFLAMVEDEVVGYCGLSEYKEDEGSLYIPLLNVHPAYQGLKIGKQLVLRAIEKTVELNWPRLDLFTWAGNTKAVPLYKKCGFFWEERDDVTHLMNFIPMVLQLDWLRPFFEKHNWYTTSQRIIEVKPDGIKENGHTYYEYKWEAGTEFVRIQVERTGRGVRLVETQDILIEMKLPAFKLLEKEEHLVTYRIVNKTDQPLTGSISGKSSTVVNHSFDKTLDIKDEWVGEVPLKLIMPQSEPSPWKTHPVVEANLEMNGTVFPLKMGVFTKRAGKLHLRSVQKNWIPQQKGTVYLDLESQLEEETTWTIKLPENEVVKWEFSEIETRLQGKERVSIPLSCELLKNEFLTKDVEVRVKRSSGQSFTFTTTLSLAFPGSGAKFGGESEGYWYIYNGPFFVKVEKRNQIAKIGSIRSKQAPLTLLTPKIGKPYSEEFSKKEATSVEFNNYNEASELKTTLHSEAFPQLTLTTFIKLYGDGLVELSHELHNEGEESKESISLLQPFIPKFENMAVPQKEGVMIGNEATIPFTPYISDKDISEPWLFTSATNGETKAIAWPKEAIGRKDDWRFAVEYKLGTIGANEKANFGPVQVGINTVSTWSDWRELVVGEETHSLKELPLYTLAAEGGSMISSVCEKINYSFHSMLTPYVHGSLMLQHNGKLYMKETKPEDAVHHITLQLEHQQPGLQSITGDFRSSSHRSQVKALQLVKGKREVTTVESNGVWTVQNGVIEFKASPTYFPGVYSLTYKGEETLHHQYPEAGPKAWWNPWGGGLRYTFQDVSAYSMLKEKTAVEFVTKVDKYGHQWTGLCLSTAFSEHETMKGVVLRQFALTLPEVPVVALFAEIEQRSGRTFTNEVLDLEAFIKPAEKLTSCYANLPTEGTIHTYYAGVEEFILKDTPFVTMGSDEREDDLIVIHPREKKMAELYMNQEVMLVASETDWSASSGEMVRIQPTILLFGDGKQTHYTQLQRLSFN
ncbi:GNAT family N-acetyltransferase [Alkalihalobacterium chitinilyticum]|uniref:GNAT family N-acetyltransferase n=1 Tax=Alkalihalobacterium chitinilyticum TaxID=2980103 RepID=A0ABT5VH68_9BACI|nr:GNAT family N-acetyltransferase [Alkalihalobacterium chitinilyticum]MDE5414791.1 GNAT family N-acetyltransferase [Alkalihalobacterium chitinilyticum]